MLSFLHMETMKRFPWTSVIVLLAIMVLTVAAAANRRMSPPSGTTAPADILLSDAAAQDAATEEAFVPLTPPDSVIAPILTYHNVRPRHEAPANVDEAYDVTPDELEAHLAYLRDNDYTSVTQRDLAAMLDGTMPVPEKPVLIGFDDGRDTHMTYAAPLLEEYGIKATFFVFTNAIDRPGYLTWDALLALEAAGHEIGSHTRYHPFLTKITDPEELEAEVGGSKRTLDARLAQPTVSIAYPFGLWNEGTVEAAKAAGYASARGLRHDVVHTEAERYDLGGYIVTGPLSQFLRILGE